GALRHSGRTAAAPECRVTCHAGYAVSTRLNGQSIVRDLFAFGGSAGGLESLIGIVQRLPRDLPATICVVLHRSPTDSTFLAPVLARTRGRPLIETPGGRPLARSRSYPSHRDLHLPSQ